MEQLLHYTWKHKMFPLGELKTTDGKVVEIIDVGLQNRNSGPDFFNAKIKNSFIKNLCSLLKNQKSYESEFHP